MSNPDDIEIKISANAEQVSAGMGRASAAVGTGAADMQSAMRAMTESVKQMIEVFKGSVAKMAADHGAATGKMKDDAEKAAAGVNLSFKGVSDSARAAADQVTGSLSGLNGMFTKFQGAFLGLTAVLAGGAAFKGAINASNEWTGEAVKLSKALGITTEQASVLNVALRHLGIDSDTYTRGAAMLSRQVNSNAQAFETLGIKVKDATGNYRPVSQVMDEVNARLAKIKNPIEQNIAGTQVYGRAWQELKPLMKLTADQMAEAEERAKRLNLVVGEEGVSQAKAYKEQMRDLELVGTSLSVQFGSKLMPVFTKMGGWMANESPAMGETFQNVLLGISAAAQTVWLTIKRLGEGLGAYAAMAASILSGDLASAKAIYKANLEDGEDFAKKMKKVWSDAFTIPKAANIKGTGPKPTEGLDFSKDKGGKGDSQVAKYEAALQEERQALAERNAIERTGHQMQIEDEAAYWETILATADLSEKDRAAIKRKAGEANLKMLQQGFEAEIAHFKQEQAAVANNAQAKADIAAKEAEAIAGWYGLNSKQYEAAEQARITAARAASEQIAKLKMMEGEAAEKRALADIEIEKMAAQTQMDIGKISKGQLLEQEQEFENRINAIKLQGLNERKASIDPATDPVQYAEICARIEELETQHQQRMAQIRNQMVVQSAQEQAKVWEDLGTRMSSLWDKGIQAMMNGTLTWRNSLKALGAEVAGWMSGIVKKMVVTWVSGEQGKTAATVAGAAQRLLAEGWAAAQSVALWAAAAFKNIMASAWEAMAGAYKAIVGIPYVGPVLAPIAAGAAFAGVASLAGHVMSAEGGFDIPAGVNPLTQLHEQEMVLPKKEANTIRSLADSGGGTPSPANVHVHINALDGADVKRVLIENRAALAQAVMAAHRDHHFSSTFR